MGIQQATIDDIQDIADVNEVLCLGLPEEHWNEFAWVAAHIWDYFVARNGKGIVGAVCLKRREGFVEVEALAVAEEMQRRGMGSKLIEFARFIAKENGFNTLRVRAYEGHNSRDFYLKQGFTLEEEPFEVHGSKVTHDFYMDL